MGAKHWICFLLALLFILFACSSPSRPDKSRNLKDSVMTADSLAAIPVPEKIDTIRGLFSGLKYADTCKLIENFHKLFMDSVIKNKVTHLPFDDIKSCKIVSLKAYSFNYKWKAFLIEGLFLPAEVPYYYYGAVNNNNLRQSEFFTQPAEISLTFEKYAFTKHALAVYGEMWTDVCSDHSSGEQKELSLLISAYDEYAY